MQITELAAKLRSSLTDKQAKSTYLSFWVLRVHKDAQQAEVNRATTYVILDELAEMGLVSQSTGQKTVFEAEPLEHLAGT
jgi:hypothetical protein